MNVGSTFSVVIMVVVVLAAIAVVIGLMISRRGKRDWAGERPAAQPGPPPVAHSDRTSYGAGATSYPSAPEPHPTPTLSEAAQVAHPSPPIEPANQVETEAEHESTDPTPPPARKRMDSVDQFRDRNRLNDPHSGVSARTWSTG